jgi:adenine-specific DNA-methyltransferase
MSQQKAIRERVVDTSGNVLEAQIAKLRSLFPEAVAEGAVDFDKLKATLGGFAESGPGRFSFTWAGKEDAIGLLQTPSRATLIPCRSESINFDETRNVFIEGENLEVLKLLFKPYFGQVKLIYIDPPYNTGKDFIYRDNYADPLQAYLELTGQADAEGNLLTSNPETSGRYHSAWLSMMYPRLFIARQLLRDDGVICVSIDDHEVHHLRMLMNEVFGEENFVATCVWQKVYSPKNTAKHFSEDHDYLVFFAREGEPWRPTLLPRTDEANARYENPDNDPRGDWKPGDLTARNYYADAQYEVIGPTGKTFTPTMGTYWRVSKAKFDELNADNRIWWGESGDNMPAQKQFITEVRQGMVPQTLWFYKDVGHTQEAKKELLEFVKYQDTDNVLDTVKPTRLLKRVLQLCTARTENDIVLDFFAGSGSTAHAVLALNREDGGNRRFICVQFPERLPRPERVLKTLSDVARQRVGNVVASLTTDRDGELDLKDRASPEDLGVKVFKLASPNIQQWKPDGDRDPEEYAKKLALFEDPLVAGWTPENVVVEVALREGFGLNSCAEKKTPVKGTTVYEVTDPDKDPAQTLVVCLDDKVSVDFSKHYPLKPDTLLICRDKALDDTAAANLALQCRLKTI